MSLVMGLRWEGPDFIVAGPSLTPPGAALEQPDGPSILPAGMLLIEDLYGGLESLKAIYRIIILVLM